MEIGKLYQLEIIMERETGLEPAVVPDGNRETLPTRNHYGAGDGTRTRDSLLGGQELYQLSYSRILKFYDRIHVKARKTASSGNVKKGTVSI
jgi:hypothetical protein